MAVLNGLLVIVLVISVITDLKERKIYNKVIFPALLLAFLLNGIQYGWSGLFESLIGFLTGLAILLIPYLMGGIGAGDVKLLALIGAVKGASFVFVSAIYMGVLGGVIGLIIFIFRKGLVDRLKSIFVRVCGIRYGLKVSNNSSESVGHVTFPYGVAIAGGAFLTFILNGVGYL